MTSLFSAVILGVCSSLWAAPAVRPTVPALGVDTVLTKGKTPREFFKDRASDAACISDLKKAKSDFKAELKALREMKAQKKASSAIDAQGAKVAELRDELLVTMEKCGECATQLVERRSVASPTRAEEWYISDGSCQLPTEDTAVLSKAFDNISDSLVHAKRYPKYSDGGFDNVLDFQIVDPRAQTFKPTADAFPKSPVNLAVWVRGPKVFGSVLAVRYYMEAKYETRKGADGKREFVLSFKTLEPKVTNRIKFPEVSDFTPSGEVVPVSPTTLHNVLGQWYINEDGYIRYYTAAEFPMKLQLLQQLGRTILIDSLTELSDRGQWE